MFAGVEEMDTLPLTVEGEEGEEDEDEEEEFDALTLKDVLLELAKDNSVCVASHALLTVAMVTTAVGDELVVAVEKTRGVTVGGLY